MSSQIIMSKTLATNPHRPVGTFPLKNAKFIGSPCMAGKADGTMPIP